jgi:hypothetical protein
VVHERAPRVKDSVAQGTRYQNTRSKGKQELQKLRSCTVRASVPQSTFLVRYRSRSSAVMPVFYTPSSACKQRSCREHLFSILIRFRCLLLHRSAWAFFAYGSVAAFGCRRTVWLLPGRCDERLHFSCRSEHRIGLRSCIGKLSGHQADLRYP